MKHGKKSAFTLVEVIVTGFIFATFASTSGLGFTGYSSDARDSKRISDVANITKKISIEVTKGIPLSSIIVPQTTNALTINANSETGYQGIANFNNLRENQEDFQDPSGEDYLVGYAMGGEGREAYKFYQAATSMESTNDAHVVGNYYKMQSGDSPSVLKNGGDFVVNDGNTLPY